MIYYSIVSIGKIINDELKYSHIAEISMNNQNKSLVNNTCYTVL